MKPRRYAGASAGAIVAALAAAGYNSAEIREVLQLNLEELLLGRFIFKHLVILIIPNKFNIE